MDFVRDLIKITSENIQHQPPKSPRDIRDEIIQQLFPKLELSEKFLLACFLERQHLERLILEKHPDRYKPDDIPIVIDKLVRTLREKEKANGRNIIGAFLPERYHR